MIVEFFGLPGSGKTTLAESFAKDGAVLVLTPHRAEMVWENILFFVWHPVRTVRLFFFIVQHAAPQYRSLALKNLFFAANAKYMRAARLSRNGKIAVIDQGHFQAFLSLFTDSHVGFTKPYIQRLIDILPRPDLLLVLDVSKEERERRIAARGRIPREEFGEEAVAAFKAAAETVYPVVLAALAEEDVQHRIIPGVFGARLPEIFLKHITYITAARMPTEKAHGISIAHMCAEFAKSGAEVSLVVPERKNQISQTVYDYYRVPKIFSAGNISTPDFVGRGYTNPFFFFLQRILFLRELKRVAIPVGVVYTREPEIAWLFSRSHRAVFEAHRWPKGIAGWLQAWLVRNTALVVCNSHGTEEAAERAGVIRTLVAPNGFDAELFAQTKKGTRAKLGLPAGMLALYSGSDNPGKGADVLRAAAKKLNEEHVSVALIGTGKKQLSPPLYELGRVSPADVPAYLLSVDMLILPTTLENEESERFTSPIKLFEYLAAGKPIIASDAPSIREILGEDDALFVSPGDPSALAEAIEILAKNKVLRTRLAARAKELSLAYSWNERAARILEALL